MMAHCFQVRTAEKSFALVCRSEDEKRAWIDALNGAIEVLKRNKRTFRLDDGVNGDDGSEDGKKSLEDADDSDEYDLCRAPVWVSRIHTGSIV
jgi:hypothetical protein